MGDVVKNIVLNFEFFISSGLRWGGASRFASRYIPKSVSLASCNFVGWPFEASYASSAVTFFLLLIIFWLLVMWLVSIC